MKASELIKLLEEKVKEHGDLDVKINNYYNDREVEKVSIEKHDKVDYIFLDCEQ